MKKNKYIVYGLVDPRTEEIFYVGKSCSGTEKMKRHTQPWSLRDHNSNKNSRIIEIMNSGLMPDFRVLAECRNKRQLVEKETVLIRELSKRQPLLNMVNNRGSSCTQKEEGKKAV